MVVPQEIIEAYLGENPFRMELRYVEGSSNKFWSLDYQGGAYATISWGRIGSKGRSQTKPVSEGVTRAGKKIRKGYSVAHMTVDGGHLAPAFRPAPPSPSAPSQPVQKTVRREQEPVQSVQSVQSKSALLPLEEVLQRDQDQNLTPQQKMRRKMQERRSSRGRW